MSTEDYRQDPPPVPPCPRCGSDDSCIRSDVDLEPWRCTRCSLPYTGGDSRAAAVRRLADTASRKTYRENADRGIQASRSALAASGGDELKEDPQ